MFKQISFWIILILLGVSVGISQAQTITQDIPEEAIGWVEGVAYAVAVRDNYAYVGFGSEFTVVDVSNKTTPIVVATLSLPGNIREIHLASDVAFVVLDGLGFWVVEVKTPLIPTMINSYLEDGLFRIVIRDQYVYGIAHNYMNIWDVTDPQNINLLSSTQPDYPDLAWVDDLAVEGTIAYLMKREMPVRSWAIDVSNPHTPVQFSSWFEGGLSITPLGRALYYYDEICTHYCTVWISSWDLSNPTEPTPIDSHVMAPVYKSLFSYRMKGEGVYLYVGTDAAVFVYLPAQPAENGQVVMAYPLAHVRDLAVSQGYLWVASEQGLIIFEDLPHQKAYLPVHLR